MNLRLVTGGADASVSSEQTPSASKAGEIAALFAAARAGEIPRGRQLLPHEPLLLNERHLLAVMMRAGGMRQCEIARELGYTDATVSIVLNHPDAAYVLDKLQGLTGVDATDIEKRLSRLSSKAVDAIEDFMDDTTESKKDKAKVGFAILNRNGFGAVKKVEHSHTVHVDEKAASLISRALRESSEIQEADYVVLPAGTSEADSVAAEVVSALPSGESPPPSIPQGAVVGPEEPS